MGWRDTKAADCEFSVRLENALLGWRPDVTLGELDAMSDGELLRLSRFGRKCLLEVREYIAALHTVDPPRGKEATVDEDMLPPWVTGAWRKRPGPSSSAGDTVRVLRLVEYVGPRAAVGEQVRRAADNTGDVRVTAITLGEFPA